VSFIADADDCEPAGVVLLSGAGVTCAATETASNVRKKNQQGNSRKKKAGAELQPSSHALPEKTGNELEFLSDANRSSPEGM
jgi:hypothetical protein